MPLRPLVTDELPDRLLFRPLARVLVRGLVKTPLTPNQVTVGACLCGVGAGVAVGVGAPIAFTVLLGLMLLLDCADGQLARLRGGGDVWGRIVDGLSDYATALSVLGGLSVVLYEQVGVPGIAWSLAAAVSSAWGAFLMDKYKRRYRGDTDDVDEVKAVRDAARGLKRFFVSGFVPYAAGVSAGPQIPDPEAYRERLRPAMALWLWLGPTTHYVLAAILIAMGRPLLFVQIVTVLGTLATIVALVLQRWLERRSPSVVETAAG